MSTFALLTISVPVRLSVLANPETGDMSYRYNPDGIAKVMTELFSSICMVALFESGTVAFAGITTVS
jgi:hypothetical protein